jgi:chloramphenicol O-acetyltransferase type A
LRKFEVPFFGVTVRLGFTKVYETSKSMGGSFFIYYLHTSLKAANSIKAFRYRIKNGKVLVFDKINASPTINRENGTFGFSYMDFHEDF